MLVGNIGIGLFILIIVWLLALVVFVFGIKYQNNLAWVALTAATIFTIFVLVIPIDKLSRTPIYSDNLGKDYILIYQVVLLQILIISSSLGFVFFFIWHCIESVRPKVIKHFY